MFEICVHLTGFLNETQEAISLGTNTNKYASIRSLQSTNILVWHGRRVSTNTNIILVQVGTLILCSTELYQP